MNNLFYIDGYALDEYQIESIKCDKNLLVVAGAGCGKTSTILGKVKYLIHRGIKEDEILCMSLTNEATSSLKKKIKDIGYNVECLTFHKLGLKIIKNKYGEISISSNNIINYIVDEYFYSIVRYSYRKWLLCIEFKEINYNKILYSDSFLLYKNSIITFINLLKNKGLDIYKIFYYYKKSIFKHNWLFILEIYLIYQRELESTNSFDFNDMIFIASNIVKNDKLILKYKYIIIDEFQDTSKIRLELVKSIIDNNNAKIMCVGDDYQSIYRFAGSDIEIFLNFKKYFNDSNIMYLRNTYRNSKELLHISTNFICKNKFQLKKELFSNKSNSKPIKIFYCNNKKFGLKKLLSIVGSDYMIVGRNNRDIKKYVDNLEDISNLNYLTAHKSKGLESFNTILINLSDDTLGFPSKVKNNKFENILFDKELYKYDEERRLFYVAITRTKNNVYMLVDKNNMSCFVKEIIKDYIDYIDFLFF